MLWRRELVLGAITLTSGCYTLTLLKKSMISKCENLNPEKKEPESISSYVYLPEISDESFVGENFHWFSMFHGQKPIYWQLFMLTKSKNRHVRHRAIKLLCDSTKLEKWEYAMISQACGSLSAVGFARSCKESEVFFFHHPFRMNKSKNLNAEVLNLIASLPFDVTSSYEQVLFERAKRISKRILNDKNIKNDLEDPFQIYHSERKKRDTLEFNKLCLQILLYHSTIKPHKFLMVKHGILKLMWEILELPLIESEIQSLIAQILANFTLEEELRNTLHLTGWLGVLASWMNSPDVSVSLPSAKALANLDIDDYHHSLYLDDVYLLHPVTRTGEKYLSADIIFVHGLFGSTFWTWRQNDAVKSNIFYTDLKESNEEKNSKNGNISYTYCWPKDWLSADFPDFRILSLDYNTDVRSWKSFFSVKKESSNFKNKAELLMQKLIIANVGKKPIIWVTHSMGGILVKQLLIEASCSNNEKANVIAKNTRGIIFFSVPHKGSDFASFLQSIPFIFQSEDYSHLNKGSFILLSLHEKFMELVQKNNISILSFGETKKSKWGLNLVSEDSSNPGIGEFYALPVDHLSTCKPESRDSKVYIKISEFLKTLIPTSKQLISNYSVFEMSNILCLIP